MFRDVIALQWLKVNSIIIYIIKCEALLRLGISARTSTPFTPNFKMGYSYKGPGFSYATNTQCLVCTPISKMPYSRFCTLNVCVNGHRKLSICVKMALHSLINTFN